MADRRHHGSRRGQRPLGADDSRDRGSGSCRSSDNLFRGERRRHAERACSPTDEDGRDVMLKRRPIRRPDAKVAGRGGSGPVLLAWPCWPRCRSRLSSGWCESRCATSTAHWRDSMATLVAPAARAILSRRSAALPHRLAFLAVSGASPTSGLVRRSSAPGRYRCSLLHLVASACWWWMRGAVDAGPVAAVPTPAAVTCGLGLWAYCCVTSPRCRR